MKVEWLSFIKILSKENDDCYECVKGQILINSQWTLASSLHID